MARILVIPDIHLKTWMLQKANDIKEPYDKVVMLGDFFDDFGRQNDIKAYADTADAIADFITHHKSLGHEVIWCKGNHDMSYLWHMWDSGFSGVAVPVVREGITKIENALGNAGYFVYQLDNTLFCHGGLTESFVSAYCHKNEKMEQIIHCINQMRSDKLWSDISPIWARPQYNYRKYDLYGKDYLQVVGHTPMPDITMEHGCLSCDVFSTHSDGSKYGCERFVIVDTVAKTYEVIA